MLRIADARSTTPSSITYFLIFRGKAPYVRGWGTPSIHGTRSPSEEVMFQGCTINVRTSFSFMLKETMLTLPCRSR